MPNVKKEIIEHGVEVDATSSPPTTAPAAAAGEDAAIRAAVADAAATLSALNLKSVPDSAADSEDAAATANAGAGQAATPNAEANQEVGVVVDSETGAAATLEAENTEMKTADRLADVNGDDMHEINLFGSKIKVSPQWHNCARWHLVLHPRRYAARGHGAGPEEPDAVEEAGREAWLHTATDPGHLRQVRKRPPTNIRPA